MSDKKEFELYVEIFGLRTGFRGIENPTEDQLNEILTYPENFNQPPLSEDIVLQSATFGLERDDPREVCGRVDLYFDHKGKVFMEYEDSVTSSYGKLRDLNCSSDGYVEVIGIEDGEPFRVWNRNMVSVEFARPFVLEFRETGEIDLSREPWERR